MSVSSATRRKITAAGLAVLIDSGYAAFTQQLVAERAKISLGNLTYHFATKSILLDAIIVDWFEQWQQSFNIALHAKTEHVPGIDEFIDWVMDSALTDNNIRLFRELWAISNNDVKLEKMLHVLYDQAVDFVLAAFAVSDLDRNDENLRNLIYVLACVSEGAAAVWINAPGSKANPDIIKNHVRTLFGPAFKQALCSATVKKNTQSTPT